MASNETLDGLKPNKKRGARASTALGTNGDSRSVRAEPVEGQAADETHTPERKCILSGRHDARDDLIRLAISPDGAVLPDVRAKAPGRGAWLGVDRPTLEAAQAKGKLKGALARAFKGKPLSIPDDLGQRIETALERAFLDRLGLESRSGTLVIGSDRIEEAARKGRVHLLMHAADAGQDGSRKLDQALRVGSDAEGSGLRGLALPVPRTILAMALGRENVVHVALVDRAAARRVGHALTRWREFIGRDGEVQPRDSSRGSSASTAAIEYGRPADGDDDGGAAAMDDVGI
jgi:predicted RNA-binding protein YlxR (DUF448 family)